MKLVLQHLVVCHTQCFILRVYLVAAVGDSGAHAMIPAYYDANLYYLQTTYTLCIWKFCVTMFKLKKVVFKQCCGAGAARSRSFLLEPEPKKITFTAPAPAPAPAPVIIQKKHFHNQEIFQNMITNSGFF